MILVNQIYYYDINIKKIYLQIKDIYRLKNSPRTIADGLRALSVSKRTLSYLQKLDDLYLVSEELIRYWTSWFFQIMQVTCEPSSAITMSGVQSWLKSQTVIKLF